jgi:hypothetical protein
MSPKTRTKRFKASDTKNDTTITNIQNNKQCYACSKTLSTAIKVVTFKENQYHDKCFACKSCKKSLVNQLFHQDKNNPNLFVCDKCNNFNNRLKKCTTCHKRLFDWDSFLIDKYKKTYCTSCFKDIKNKACAKCLKEFEINKLATASSNNELKQVLTQMEKQNKMFKNSDNSSSDNACSICD